MQLVAYFFRRFTRIFRVAQLRAQLGRTSNLSYFSDGSARLLTSPDISSPAISMAFSRRRGVLNLELRRRSFRAKCLGRIDSEAGFSTIRADHPCARKDWAVRDEENIQLASSIWQRSL